MRKPAVSAGHHLLPAQQEGTPVDSQERQAIVDGADLLGSAFGGLLQDVERGGTGDDAGDDANADADGEVSLKDGVSKDRWCWCMIPR